MKKRRSGYISPIVIALAVVLASCSGSSEPEVPTFPEPGSFRGRVHSASLIGEHTADALQRQPALQGLPLRLLSGVRLYKVVYESIDKEGKPTLLSGAVAIPTEATAAPLLCYNRPTAMHRDSIPSKQGFSLETILLAGTGYVLASPDYHGYGESRLPPGFLHAEGHAAAAIDIIRAARTITRSTATRLNSQVFLAGYSQGGYAAMAAQREIERSFAQEIRLTASALMAGPYNVSEMFMHLMLSGESYAYPGYVAYLLHSYNAIYGLWGDNTETFRQPFGQTISTFFQGAREMNELHSRLPAVPRSLFTSDFLLAMQSFPNFPARLALRRNTLLDWAPVAPTRLYHATADEQVPFSNSSDALAAFRQRGSSSVQLIEVNAEGHTQAALPSLLSTKIWFDSLATITLPRQ